VIFIVTFFSGLVSFVFGGFLLAAAHTEAARQLKQKAQCFHERISSQDEEMIKWALLFQDSLSAN